MTSRQAPSKEVVYLAWREGGKMRSRGSEGII